jgi:hypothetical protein
MIINDAIEALLLPPEERAQKERRVLVSFRDENGPVGHIASDVPVYVWGYPEHKPRGKKLGSKAGYYHDRIVEDLRLVDYVEDIAILKVPRPNESERILRISVPLSRRTDFKHYLRNITSDPPANNAWPYPFYTYSIAKTIRQDMGSLSHEVDVHEALLAVFEQQRRAEQALNEYCGRLEILIPENRTRTAVKKNLERIVEEELEGDERARTEAMVSEHLGTEVNWLVAQRKEFLEAQERARELMTGIDPYANVFEYHNQDWHALLIVSDVLERKGQDITFREYPGKPLVRDLGFNPAVNGWPKAYCDTETTGFPTKKEPPDEWFEEEFYWRYAQRRPKNRADMLTDAEKQRIKAEVDEDIGFMRESITHIGLGLVSKDRREVWQGRVYRYGLPTGQHLEVLLGTPWHVSRLAFVPPKEDVHKFYDGLEKRYLAAWRNAETEQERNWFAERVMERFGIEVHKLKEKKDYLRDVRLMLSQLSMQSAMVGEFVRRNPWALVFQNGPFDIGHMNKTSTILAAARAFGIDVTKYAPRVTGLGHALVKDPFRKHVRIAGHLYRDTMLIAKHCLPDCETRSLEGISEYRGMDFVKGMNSAYFNYVGWLIMDGCKDLSEKEEAYHILDIAVLEAIDRSFEPQDYALGRLAKTFPISLEDLLAERDRMQDLWELRFRRDCGFPSERPFKAKKDVSKQQRYRDAVKVLFALDQEHELWRDDWLSGEEDLGFRDVHVVHIPRALFLKDVLAKCFPYAKDFLEQDFTLEGKTQRDREIQTTYARYLRALAEPMFFDMFELEQMNQKYEISYAALGWSREAARELHKKSRSKELGRQRITWHYIKEIKRAIAGIENACEELTAAVNEHEEADVRREYGRCKRRRFGDQSEMSLEELAVVRIMHPEIVAGEKTGNDFKNERTINAYQNLLLNIEAYRGVCKKLEKNCPYAFNELQTMSITVLPEDFLYLHIVRDELSDKSVEFCRTYRVSKTDVPVKMLQKGYRKVRDFFGEMHDSVGAKIVAQKGDRVFFTVQDGVSDEEVRRLVDDSGCLTYQRKRDYFEVKYGPKDSNRNVTLVFR